MTSIENRPLTAAPAADFLSEKTQVRRAVEDFLIAAFDKYPPTEVCRAARYAAVGGGHRWRAIVAVAAGRIFDENALQIVLPGACGAELAHAASLVLDDLPSMDNADVRRGKPSTHRAFPAWAVDMAPVFLITMAYEISLANPHVPHESRVKAALTLSGAGLEMISGQVKDIEQEHATGKADESLLECYRLKSGALYAASAKAGALLCGASDREVQSIHAAGMNLGLSYQLLDDVADVVADVQDVGKPAGMDADKWTAVNWLGVDGARRKSLEFQSRGLHALEGFGPKADWLRTLICEASWKTH